MTTNQSPLPQDITVSALDLAVPAAVLFLLLYYPLCLLLGITGVQNLFLCNLILLMSFGIVFGILYLIKYQAVMNNVPLHIILLLIDTNVGLKFTNMLVIACAAGCAISCLFTGHGILFAAFAVITGAFAVNLFFEKERQGWELTEPGSAWSRHHSPEFSPIVPVTPAGKKVVQFTFNWDPVLQDKNIPLYNHEEVTVSFLEPDYLDENSADFVRKDNPFYSAQPQSYAEYPTFAAGVKLGSKDPYEKSALSLIIQSAEDLCRKYNLADYEMYDLLLKFCQHCIKYVVDEESEPINRIPEYFRFPGETLFDREGDCDCKSVLAYRLFHLLGAEAELVCVSVKNDQNPDNHLNHCALILRDSGHSIKLPPTYQQEVLGSVGRAVYCDATAKGYEPGYCGPELDKESVLVIG